jgi:pre-60S factor REI1
MNPEAIDLVDEFYDYSAENLDFLQRKFDNLQIKNKNDIQQNEEEKNEIIEEDEWEDYESESEDEIEEKKDEIEEKKDEKEEKKEDENEKYVLIRGYWHPLKDKIVTSKFIKDNLDLNDKEEVVLPGGRILGHKKYAKYYKQNMVEVVKKKSEIVRALAYREMQMVNRKEGGTVAKYESVLKTLER